MGDQVYTCTASAAGGAARRGAGGAGGSGATTYSFVLKQPDAKLYDQSNTQVGTHGAGPNWTSTVDASVVNGAKVWQENSPTAGAIPWLLLRATSNTGTGVFSDITYVQRVNTTGGMAPATGCDATTAGTDTRVAYTADYYFYNGGGPGTAWMTPPGSLPTAIAVPSGATFKIHDHAIGVQVYTCTASAAGGAGGGGGAGGRRWQRRHDLLVGAQAAGRGALRFELRAGRHARRWGRTGPPPTASVVNGAKVAGVNSTMSGAVAVAPPVKRRRPRARASSADITYVQRLNTAGGPAPATGCDATSAATDIRIPYSADYYFFTGGTGGSGGGGGGSGGGGGGGTSGLIP